jgi:hypothetical protein
MRKPILFLALILGVVLALVPGASAETFEDVYDDASNFTNVAVAQNIIANVTFWGFNNSIFGPPLPDNFLEYTAISASGYLTRNSSYLAWDGNMRYVSTEYAYTPVHSPGSGASWVYEYDVYVEELTTSTRTIRCTSLMLTNSTDDYRGILGINGYAVAAQISSRSNNQKWFFIFQRTWGGASGSNTTEYSLLDIETWYYIQVSKNATYIQLRVFTDEARTIQVAQAVLNIVGNDFRYTKVYAISNVGYATSENSKGYIRNMFTSQNGGVMTEGWVYTKALVTGQDVIVLTYQQFLTNGATIGVSFSSDNVTWVNQQNFGGGEDTPGTGWQALTWEKLGMTTAYIRFHFERPNQAADCELRQWRLIYQSELVGGLNGYWSEYNVSAVTLRAGNPIHGNITSMAFRDGKTFRVEEIVSQVPAVDARVNFTGIPSNIKSLSIRLYDVYDGSPTDEVHYDVWNFETLAWITVSQKGEGAFEWTNISLSYAPVSGLSDFIEDGKVWFRMHEPGSGVPGHYIEGDYIRLRGFTNTTIPSFNVTLILDDVAGDWEIFYLDTVAILEGTNVWGNLTSLKYRDGKTMFGYEGSGTPGVDVRGNYTIPARTIGLSMRSFNRFDGTPSDHIGFEVWDFEAEEWDTIGESFNDGVWEWTNSSISLNGEYRDPINSTHERVWLRMHHPESGVPSHEIETDMVVLMGFVPQAKTGGLFWLVLLSLIIVAAALLSRRS